MPIATREIRYLSNTLQDVVSRWTTLHFAAQKGQLETIKALLDHGANPTTRTFDIFSFLGDKPSAVQMSDDVTPTQKTAVRALLKDAEKAWKGSGKR